MLICLRHVLSRCCKCDVGAVFSISVDADGRDRLSAVCVYSPSTNANINLLEKEITKSPGLKALRTFVPRLERQKHHHDLNVSLEQPRPGAFPIIP